MAEDTRQILNTLNDHTGALARLEAARSEDSAKIDKLQQVLDKFANTYTEAQRAAPEEDKAAHVARAYTTLENHLNLPPGTLANKLPAFAEKLLAAPETSDIDKAKAPFAIGKFAEAEDQYLLSDTGLETEWNKAQKVADEFRTKRIESLEGAAQSATAQIQYARAVDHYHKAASITSLECNPLEWAHIHHMLAFALYDHGQYPEAADIMRQTIPVREKHLGAEHPDTLSSRNDLAIALQEQGKYAEAEEEHRAVLPIRQRVLDAEHPKVFLSLHNLSL